MNAPCLSRRVLLIAILCLIPAILKAQVSGGTYAFGSFDQPGIDTINPGNLNAMISIPIIAKPGRGGNNFTYTLNLNTAVWYPVSVSGVMTWVNTQNWGWQAQTEVATGYISEQQIGGTVVCNSVNTPFIRIQNVVYWDTYGGAHHFTGSKETVPGCTSIDTLTNTYSKDGKYKIGTNQVLTDRHGDTITVPVTTTGAPTAYTTGSYVDTNGNTISVDNSGNFTDTTGTVVLAVSGTAPSPVTMKYTDPGGTSRSATVNYVTYSVKTDFQCSEVAGEASISSAPLVDNIVLSDGETYHFKYESTPSASGSVTGRVSSITLPQGGVITYSYPGANDGIVCADGSNLALTRQTTNDNGSSSISYVRTPATTTSHTEVEDASGNYTELDFVIATGSYFETNRAVYQGPKSGTPLMTRQTCYNQAATPCTTTSLTLPISQIDTYQTMNGIEQSGTTSKYNTYELETESDIYDFGTATARGSLLQKEVWAYPSSGIVSLVSSENVYDGAGNSKTQTSYQYDNQSYTPLSGLPQHTSVATQRGNLTNVVYYNLSSSSGNIATTNVYDDAGNITSTASTAGGMGGTTTYSYDPSTDTFLTTTSLPTPSSGVAMTTGASYDVTSGALKAVTDQNSQSTTASSFEGLGRPQTVTYPTGGGSDSLTYSATQIGKTHQFSSSGSTESNQQTLFDGYARQSRTASANGQGSNPWYQQDTCHDGNARVYFTSTPYAGAGFSAAKVCSGPGDTYQYDALGRLTSDTHADGTSVTYSYLGRATEVSNEHGVKRITQADGMGRPVKVCEITSVELQSAPTSSCGTDISGTGYYTTYAYTFGSGTVLQVTTVTQGAQTRIFKTDSLNRLVYTSEPESGVTQYNYSYSGSNGVGWSVSRIKPAANQASASTTTTTTTKYDTLGRIISVTYSDGTPTKTFTYDAPNSSQWTESAQQTNVKGHLSSHSRTTAAGVAASMYGYDAMGRVSVQYSCLPSGCGTATYDRSIAYGYNYASMLTSESDGAGYTQTIGRSSAGEITGITSTPSSSTNPSTLMGSVQNSVFGPTSYAFGNGLNAVYTYDSMGRVDGGYVCSGSTSAQCDNGGTQLYGFTVGAVGNRVSGFCDTVVNTCDSLGYDDFNRLTSMTTTQGTTQNFTYTYDRYGNRWSQTAPQGGPAPSLSFNQSNNIISTSGYANDAAGNVANDGINSYSYDADGNVISVNSGSTATYYYDSLNHRVRIAPTRGTYEFVFDQYGKRMSVWGSGHSLTEANAYTDTAPLAIITPSGTTFEHQNWLGTERIRTDYTGAKIISINDLSWGDGHTPTGDNGDQHDFAGMERDLEDSNEHATYRNYSTLFARWMSPDPYLGSYDFSNPQTFNRFAYALNNPLYLTDSSGLDGDCGNQNAAVHALDDPPAGSDPCGGGGGVTPPPGPPESDPCSNADGCSQGTPPPIPDPEDPPANYVLGGGSAPNNGTPTTPQPCLAQRVGNALPGAQFTGSGTLSGAISNSTSR